LHARTARARCARCAGLTERGTAIAVFALRPCCRLRGGNVAVDTFVGMYARAARRAPRAAAGRSDEQAAAARPAHPHCPM